MHSKTKLPSLTKIKNKTIDRDRSRIEDLLSQNTRNRLTHKDYRQDQDFKQLKAGNFLSRIDTIDSPDLIFAVTDHLESIKGYGKENQFNKFDNQSTKSAHYHLDTRRMGEERIQVLNLAKWVDQKLQKFKAKKTITFMDILDYKQTVLNYALGKIIDSLTKKCKQQGQLLSLIWNNTFTMFEGVFNILATANQDKDKEKISQQKQLYDIYQTNHNFLREQNTNLMQQNEAIFEKMKKVINWNKRLRKERKKLHTQNRILNYRNHTYHLALEQTIQMLLRTVPEPATIHTAKRIIQKLAKEKGRKKKFLHKQSDQQFISSSKQYVYKWLKRNSFLKEDVLSTFINQELSEKQLLLEDIEDINQMKNVNIYDFFKLQDVGVQFNPSTKTLACQSEQLPKKNMEVMTKMIKMVQNGSQTANRIENQTNLEQVRRKATKNNSKQPVQNKLISRQKNRKKVQKQQPSQRSIRNGKKNTMLPFEERKMDNRFHQRISNRQHSKYDSPAKLAKDEVHSVKKIDQNNSVGFRFNQYQGALEKEFDNLSLSGMEEDGTLTKGHLTTKNFLTNRSFGSRLSSIRDTQQYDQYSGMFDKLQRNKRKKTKKLSVAYISDRHHFKPDRNMSHLNLKRKFTDAYKQTKKNLDENKEEFYDQIIRRRSFYGKKKVQFANFRGAQDAKLKTKQFLRGRNVKNRIKTLFEHSNYVYSNIQKLTKKVSGPSNIAKTRTLLNSQATFSSIHNSIQQIARIPPSNKVFVANSLTSIIKYIEGLLPQYIKQVKKKKQELVVEDQKAFYPLNVLLMEQMTFKYGLKGIAEKKIKNFIQKVLTFAPISQKVGLFSLLLGLQQPEVGSDELLVYIKCLVYFDCKKAFRDVTVTDSLTVDVEIVRQNLRKILSYFFDHQYVNLIELKLQIYFQQTAPYSTVEGITIIIVKQLLRRKKQIKQKYEAIYNICQVGDNFFTNIYKVIKMMANYKALASAEEMTLKKSNNKRSRDSVESIGALQKIRNRDYKRKEKVKTKSTIIKKYDIQIIGTILKELLQRSDIIDQEYGKSITLQRFITAAVIYGIPTFSQLQPIFQFFKEKLLNLRFINPTYASIQNQETGIDKQTQLWKRQSVMKENTNLNNWNTALLFSQKLEEEVTSVMGKLGTIGLYIQSSLLNMQYSKPS